MVSNSYGDLGEDIDPGTDAEFDADRDQAAATGHRPLLLVRRRRRRVDATWPSPRPTSRRRPTTSPRSAARASASTATARPSIEQGWATTIVSQDADGAWASAPPGDFLYGAGGGTSRLYREPDYQKGVVPDALAQAWSRPPRPRRSRRRDGRRPEHRNADRSDADVLRRRRTTTSSASVARASRRPLFTGVMAVADQVAGFHHGFVEPGCCTACAAPRRSTT